jgi:hypothetical protein
MDGVVLCRLPQVGPLCHLVEFLVTPFLKLYHDPAVTENPLFIIDKTQEPDPTRGVSVTRHA